tara:strand:+ start:339 stop:590 length:252 start_codon:yes stop_codon:yes gene_type:complete
MKNKYKKSDAKGNKLNENMGSGLNLDHFLKVKEARLMNADIRFRINISDKLRLKEVAAKIEVSESEILRCLLNSFLDGSIKIK